MRALLQYNKVFELQYDKVFEFVTTNNTKLTI